MTNSVHYEVFRRVGKGGGWALVEAVDGRDSAIALARALLAEGRAAAVRVIKETFQAATGEYLSLVVLEEGSVATKKNKNDKVDDGTNPVPCFKPDDLYTYHARTTLLRLIGEYLARQKLTPTELIHSAAALEKFEATGTTFQHAIQKTAVAQASGTDIPVAQIIKQLNSLTTAAIRRIYADEKAGLFPETDAGDFGILAVRLAEKPDALYRLNGVIAKYLAPAADWDAKLTRILALMEALPHEGPPRALLLGAVDSLVAELLSGSAALADLLGSNPDLGRALVNLVELFTGATVCAQPGGQGLNELAKHFAADDLPEARTAIANRILAELKGPHRLCPASMDEELQMLRRLANDLVRAQGKYLSHNDLIAAFVERSKRLVHNDALVQYLANTKSPDEKFDRLMALEESIIGAENKRMLAAFLFPIITSNAFEDQVAGGAKAPQRLRRLAEMQERVMRASFQDEQKNQLCIALDGVAQRVDERMHFLSGIERGFPNAVERAQTLLKLIMGGVFPQGDLLMRARRLLCAALARPGFLSAYAAQTGVGREEAAASIAGQLEKTGVPVEDTLRLFAA